MPRHDGTHGAAGRTPSVEQRRAASEFMVGFWSNPETRKRVSLAMRIGWEDFKNSGRYARLVERLSEASRDHKNGRH